MSLSSAIAAFRYFAFISYSHQDKAWADWLHKALETYAVPKRLVDQTTAMGVIPKRLIPIFRDRDELASAHDLGDKVNQALAQSANLIVICSPRAATSRWVQEEVLAFKRLGHIERIFCLIVDGEPNASDLPSRESKECFAPALRFQIDRDGQLTAQRTEPIAADARVGKDGKTNAKLKLIAGLLDVGFDDLKQRELRRRARRVTAILSVALAVMVVTTVLAILALLSRHQALVAQHTAVAAEQTAVVAKQAAQRRQRQAEDLVDFMLGDLNDKLRQVSRPDIMEAVDDKATAYFEDLPAADITDTELAERAKTLEKIGSIRESGGSRPKALEAFRASARISSRLAAKAPTDVARQVAYSRTLAFIAAMQMYQAKWGDAAIQLNLARKVLQPSLAQAPNDPALQIQMAYLDNNIGHVMETRGKPQVAETRYQEMLALVEKLVLSHPDDPDYIQALGAAHGNLGRMAMQRNDITTAIGEYRAADAVQTADSIRHPRDDDRRIFMIYSHVDLGVALASIGDVSTAIRNLQQAIDFSAALVKGTPRDEPSKALYSLMLARLKRQGGDLREANTLNAKALAIFAALYKGDPSSQRTKRHLAEAFTEQALQLRAAGQVVAALAPAQRAMDSLEPMLAAQPESRETLLSTITAKLTLASVTRDAPTARRLREQALLTMQSVEADKNDPGVVALQVQTLLSLDREPEAQPLIRQLWNNGYRGPAFIAVLRGAHIDYPANPAFQARLATVTGKGSG